VRAPDVAEGDFPMQRIALGVEYDGSGFAGWQVQRGRRTVSAELGAALARVADQPVDLICGGRTDAGVHATGQVVHFDAPVTRSLRGWLLGLNSNLPADISVRWARPVPAWFHARYSALSRTYRYCILNRDTRCALRVRRATWVRRPLDPAAMQAAADRLVGEHDFSAFRASECQSRSPVRRVERIEIGRDGHEVWIEVAANAFLHHMVRNLAGLLIDVGTGDAAPAWAAEVLESRDRRRGAMTAPPDGLYLRAIRYPPAFRLPEADAHGPGVVEQARRSAMIPPH
jgi:tRNA pseudouridine38-40 synthase